MYCTVVYKICIYVLNTNVHAILHIKVTATENRMDDKKTFYFNYA